MNKFEVTGNGTDLDNCGGETINKNQQGDFFNTKSFRLLTVAIYIFLWDSTMTPLPTYRAYKVFSVVMALFNGSFKHVFFNYRDKIVIPEQIAIQLLNSSEVSAEQFYKNVHEYYQRHRNQYLWSKDSLPTNLQSSTLNKIPKQYDSAQSEASTSATNHQIMHHSFTKLKDLNEVALIESLSTSSLETHGATAPPINEKPSNYDDEDYSEDDPTLGDESSGFLPFNFKYNNRRKLDAD